MLLKAVLLCTVCVVIAEHIRILPNDDEDPLCVRAACDESEMCVIDGNDVKCVDQSQLEHLVKKHGLKHSPHKPHKSHKDHAKHDFQSGQKCTHSELQRMGGRLLKWFKDVHSHLPGLDRTLRTHSVSCRPDVAWMFQQWDGNSDGLLSKSELRPIERGGGNEPCTEQFIDMCDDIDVDGSVSIDEWCDCFSFADDSVHEPPCHKAKHGSDPHLLGVFLPRCDLEGFYKPEQCHEGECWCVDRYGREFDKSRVSNTLPDCGQYASDLTEEDIAVLKARI